MPIYEYRCKNGHTIEVMQRMSDDRLASCTTCEAPVQRVFHPVAVHFKGSGFYNTDYGKKSKGADEANDAKNRDEGKSKSDSDSSSKGSSSESSSSTSSDSDGSKSDSKTTSTSKSSD